MLEPSGVGWTRQEVCRPASRTDEKAWTGLAVPESGIRAVPHTPRAGPVQRFPPAAAERFSAAVRLKSSPNSLADWHQPPTEPQYPGAHSPSADSAGTAQQRDVPVRVAPCCRTTELEPVSERPIGSQVHGNLQRLRTIPFLTKQIEPAEESV